MKQPKKRPIVKPRNERVLRLVRNRRGVCRRNGHEPMLDKRWIVIGKGR